MKIKYSKQSTFRFFMFASLLVSVVFMFTSMVWRSAVANRANSINVAAVNVEVYPVSIKPMPTEINSLGSLQAINQVSISSEVDGRIEHIYFKNGQEVGKGMPIIQLDDQTQQADLSKAVSKLKVDRLKYNAQKLAAQAVAKIDLENQKALVQQDETDVSSAQAAVAQRQIKAPFSGVLGDFKVSEGDFIKAGVTLIKLVNTQQLRAVYALSEDLLPQLKNGQLVMIKVDAFPKQTFYGTVNYVSPSVDQTARTVAVQALVQNTKNLLSPGMFIHVAQQINIRKDALVIPEQALLVDIKGSYVYKIVNHKAVRVGVSVGTRKQGVAQITSGLQAGDQVVVAGQQKLIEGTAVQIVPTLPSVIQLMNRVASGEDPASSGAASGTPGSGTTQQGAASTPAASTAAPAATTTPSATGAVSNPPVLPNSSPSAASSPAPVGQLPGTSSPSAASSPVPVRQLPGASSVAPSSRAGSSLGSNPGDSPQPKPVITPGAKGAAGKAAANSAQPSDMVINAPADTTNQ